MGKSLPALTGEWFLEGSIYDKGLAQCMWLAHVKNCLCLNTMHLNEKSP